MPHPKVTIITPVYNTEAYLRSCLNSATQQTLKNIEIICVDDASTDSSPDILSEYANNDTRVRVIRHDDNKGEGAARNTGLDAARGEYIFHLDADDTIPLNSLELLYTEAHSHGSDMVKGGFIKTYEEDRVDNNIYSAPKSKVVNTNIYESSFLQKIPTGHWSYLYKRQFLNLHKIRYRTDLIIGLDLVVLTTALIHAHTVTLIPDVVYHYHQSKTSVMRGKLSTAIVKSAVIAKKVTADTLNTKGLHEAAISRLNYWDFIIATYWLRMPFSLTADECTQIFSDFRILITENNIVPWRTNTPHHYRYLLALLLASQDERAISFLRTKDALDGFSDKDSLKKSLEFVLERVPGDIGALMELGHIILSEGNMSKALSIFQEVIRFDATNFDAHIRSADILEVQGRIKEARDQLDDALKIILKGHDSYNQIKRVTSLKDDLTQAENATKLNMARKELNKVHDELNAIYNSTSWRITEPLRKFKSSLRSHLYRC